MQPDGPCLVPPLGRGYTREPQTEREIESFAQLPAAEIGRRIEEAERAVGRMTPETIVHFVRRLCASAEHEAGWRLVGILQARAERTIHIQFAKLYMTPIQRDEAAEQIAVMLIEAWLSTDDRFAFWEARFGFCFRKAIIDAVKRAKAGVPVVEIPRYDDQEAEPLDELEDKTSVAPEELAAAKIALGRLPEPILSVFYLYSVEGWSQTEIATELGITDRTVRNRLARANDLLKEWRDEEQSLV